MLLRAGIRTRHGRAPPRSFRPGPVHVVVVEELPVQHAVEVVGLTKQFTRRKGRKRTRVCALEGVSFTLARGECVAVLGQNGSGKSTLVRALSTLLIYDGGTARVFGHDVAREEGAVRRLVNRVSVEASFFKRLSATENLSYAARFYGLGRAQTKREIPQILASLGFPTERAGAPMEDDSRGMQPQVALARALLTSPTLLLLDEPTTGLDPRSKREVQQFIRQVRRTHDTTTLLCTHDMAEAEALADRVGILHRGRLLALEDARALRRRYGAATLEDAFFAATGRAIEDDIGDDDEEAA